MTFSGQTSAANTNYRGSWFGWLSPPILIGLAIFIISTVIFFVIEARSNNGFVDLTLFNNKTYSGATLSNFLLNGAAGTLLVSLTLVQEAAFGVAISAAIFYGLSNMKGISPMAEIAMGRTDNVNVRYAAAIALLFNVFMVAVAIIAILLTVPKSNSKPAIK